jgi:hypothetical protein
MDKNKVTFIFVLLEVAMVTLCYIAQTLWPQAVFCATNKLNSD